jgi:uncharacterized protein
VAHVHRLRRNPGATVVVDVHGVVADLAVAGVAVPDGAEAGLTGSLASYPGGIEVTGRVRAPWRAACRRCGAPIDGMVDTEVRERCVPGGPASGDEEAYELADELDLEPLVRDAVLLALPLAPLCRETCAGLCPECGADRNVAPCGCRPPADPRWSALDALAGPGGGDPPLPA